MLSYGERNLVKWVAKLSPWLAPLPSGFFVARSSIKHLDLPFPIGIAIGVIIELLGIASVHTWLWLSDWNTNKRKNDPSAPSSYAASLGFLYLAATFSLTVVLEVQPHLSTLAPAMFPVLAVVGALNLALIARQEQREKVVERERRERQTKSRYPKGVLTDDLFEHKDSEQPALAHVNNSIEKVVTARKLKKDKILNTIVDILNNNPDIGVTDLARHVGRSRTTIYKYLGELNQNGHLNLMGGEGRNQSV